MNNVFLECSAVLFDLDGTLVDSTRIVARIWDDWARKQGLDPEWVMHIAHGQRTYDSVRTVAPYLTIEQQHQAFNDIEGREIVETDGLVIFEGGKQLLESLPPDRWTIVTSGTRPLAEARLRAAGLPIPARMITADDVQNGKPNPEPYLKGAEIVGAPPEQCVVLEDAPSGIRSAKAAGMKAIAVATTYPVEDLKDADVIAPNLGSLRAESSGGRIRVTVQNAIAQHP
jgi:mannitol-1-/sugar-/sorbitol-6-phosphatase